VLLSDVQSAGTCFAVTSDRVILDLAQHSITYGVNTSAQTPVYGVVGQACWDNTPRPSQPCGDRFSDLVVRNGRIQQGPGAPAYSHAIRVGQGNSRGFTFTALEIWLHAPASVGISSTYTNGDLHITNVTTHNEVKQIFNRHQVEGPAIRIAQIAPASEPNEIKENRIIGGPQGAILDITAGTDMIGNHLSLAGTYTNDFGIYAWGDRQQVVDNRIDGQGRGIQVYRGKGAIVRRNSVDVFEKRVNMEYQGCQLGGSMGIQLETRARDAEISGNKVTASADECDARAFRATDTESAGGNVSRANVYVAKRVGSGKGQAIAASFSNAKDVTLVGDTLEADSANVEIDWDGAQRIYLRQVEFAKGKNPAPDYVTFRFLAGSNDPRERMKASQLFVVDGTFKDGASAESVAMHPIGYGGWASAAEYFIQWSTRFKVITASGSTITGAVVLVTPPRGETSSLTTDETGTTPPLALTQFRRFNTGTGVDTQVFRYGVEVQYSGRSKRIELEPSTPQTVNLLLN
jgi:hypothetical protein